MMQRTSQTMSRRLAVYQGETFAVGNTHTKILILHTTRFCFHLICYKLTLSVFFIKHIWVFTENTLIIFWLRLVYLKTDTTLHSYRLLGKQHCLGKNASIFGTGYFSNWPAFGAKWLYGCYLEHRSCECKHAWHATSGWPENYLPTLLLNIL